MNLCCVQPAPGWMIDPNGGHFLACQSCGTAFYPANNLPTVPVPVSALGALVEGKSEVQALIVSVEDTLSLALDRIHTMQETEHQQAEGQPPWNGAESGIYEAAWTKWGEISQSKASWGKKTIRTALNEIEAELGIGVQETTVGD